MIQTLNRFSTESLFDATSHLLKKLNIEFDRETAEPIDVADLYDGPMPQYLKGALDSIKYTYFIGIVNDKSLAGTKSADSLEDVAETIQHGGKYDGLFIFACEAKQDANLTRTAAAALTRAFNRLASANPVILIIRQNNLLSLSTCERMNYSQEWRQGRGEKLGKVSILRNINCVNPHRGHVDILASLGDKTYPTFEELYKHWMDVFSSELLTKKFYSELSDWYAWAVQVARFPNDLTSTEDDDKFNHESCIRLITRLIFVWFLKQKHLIPEEFFDEKYIKENFIDEFNPHDKKNLLYNPDQSKYYRLILQNLFFAMLNCPIVAEGKDTPNNRRFRGDGQKGYLRDGYNVNNLMRYKNDFKKGGAEKFVEIANTHVPFLNGELFECLDKKPENLYYDGFSERKESLEQLYLPDWLFFGDELGRSIDLSEWYGDNNKAHVSASGIIDILKKYNFTIEENTPLDQEVSLDPELLGKAFENLLASYNPETQTSARKQTGSFYTPREIVQYMVDESLIAHLKRTCGEEMEPEYRKLLSYSTEETTLSDEQRKTIMHAIYNCRVLDPACGSGAFPMGILQQLVHVLRQLDPTNEMWKDFMIDLAIEQSKVAFAEDEEEERKARLTDIEEAFNKSINDPDYARKLYLIEHCIYGVDIQPIAVQISKLRFFISLVVDQKPTNDATRNFGIRPLPNLESKFVAANTLIPIKYNGELLESSSEVIKNKSRLKDLNHQIFLAKRNIDKQRLKQEIKETRLELAKAIEDTGFVGQGAAQLLANWDMFDQNTSSPFFDPEWMFGVKDGFDIVIGNPPYIRRTSIPEKDKAQYKFLYHSAKKQYDIYLLFIECGLLSLASNGLLSYINPIRFFNSDYGEGCRKFIMKESNIKSILDVSQLRVFETALTYPCVLLLEKGRKHENVVKYIRPNNLSEVLNSNSLPCLSFEQSLFNTSNNVFIIPTGDTKSKLIAKIDASQNRISNYFNVARGLANNKVNFNGTTYNAIKSKSVDRYRISGEEIYVDTDDAYRFVSQMVILPRTVLYLKSTVKREHLVLLDRIYYLTPKQGIVLEPQYIVGIINSKLTNFWFNYKYSSTKVSGNYFDLNGNQIKSIPLPKAVINRQHIISIVDRILEKEGDPILENRIDFLVYQLYGLTYDEVLVIDPETPISRKEYDNFKLD